MSATLAEQQLALLSALWADSNQEAMKFIAPHAALAGPRALNGVQRGLQAYRAHGRALARRALGSTYPVLVQMLEEENFVSLARLFWRMHPPQNGDVACWGDALPAFIETLPQLSGEPFLADVARVEWALHRAATAPDIAPEPATWASLATGDAAAMALVLSPACQCISSAWPVVSLVGAHLDGQPTLEEAANRLAGGTGELAVIWRQGFKPCVREAQQGEMVFLQAVQAGKPLLRALELAPQFDFNAWLVPAVQTGLLLAVRQHAAPTPSGPEKDTQ